jgi:hypothetical protein
MAECQSRGVERLPGSGSLQQLSGTPRGPRNPPAATAPVDRIAHDRVTQVGQVDSNLVGPAGMQLETEEIDHIESGHDRGIGSGCPATGADDHALAVLGVAGDGQLDPHRGLVQVSPRQSRIAAPDSTGGDGGSEPAVGDVGLGHDHET